MGISSLVAMTLRLGLNFLHNSATSLTVVFSFDRWNVSRRTSDSPMNFIALATSRSATRLLCWIPPEKRLIVPF